MSGGLDVVSSADGGFGARLDAFCDNMTPEAAIALLKEIQGDKPEIQLKLPTEAHEVTARFEVQQAVTLAIAQRGSPPPSTACGQDVGAADALGASLPDGAGPSEFRTVVESMGGLKAATGFPIGHVTATSCDQSGPTSRPDHSAAQEFFARDGAEIAPLQHDKTAGQITDLTLVDDGLNIWDFLPDASAWDGQMDLSTNSTEFQHTLFNDNEAIEDADNPLPQSPYKSAREEASQVLPQDTAGPQKEGNSLDFQTSSEMVSQLTSRSPPTSFDPLATPALSLDPALATVFNGAQRSLAESPPSTPPELTSGPTSDEDGDHIQELRATQPKKIIKRKSPAGSEGQGLADSAEPARRRKRRANQDYAKDMEAAGSSLIQFPVKVATLKPPEAYGIDANATARSHTSDGQSIDRKIIKDLCPWVLDARNAEKREPCNAEISGNGLDDFIKNLQNHIFIAHNLPLSERNSRQRYLCRALLDTPGKALCPSRITTGVPYQCRLATHIAREHLDMDVPKNYNPNAPGSA